MDPSPMLWDALSALLWGLLLLAPLWLALGALALLKGLFYYHERERLFRSGIYDIDRMDGRSFEQYLEVLFTRLGYRVERTRLVGDWGADLVLRKEGERLLVQAKRYRRRVGVKAVQEAVAAKPVYGCTGAMVVTNSFFTKQAVELARANRVLLWDRSRLVAALLAARTGRVRPGAEAWPPLRRRRDVCAALRGDRASLPLPQQRESGVPGGGGCPAGGTVGEAMGRPMGRVPESPPGCPASMLVPPLRGLPVGA